MTKVLTPYENLERLPTAQPQNTSIMDSIMALAKDKDFDASKLQLMQQMFFTQQDREREAAFAKDFVSAQGEMPKIPKRGFNAHTKSKYEFLEDVVDFTTPVMEKWGFGISFGEYESAQPNCIGISATLFHKDGHTKDFKYDCPIDAVGTNNSRNKTDVHAKGSAISYGRRYLTKMIWNLSTGDDDDGNAANARLVQKITEEQVAELEALIQDVGADKKLFLQYLKCSSLSDIPAVKFKAAVEALEKKRGK